MAPVTMLMPEGVSDRVRMTSSRASTRIMEILPSVFPASSSPTIPSPAVASATASDLMRTRYVFTQVETCVNLTALHGMDVLYLFVILTRVPWMPRQGMGCAFLNINACFLSRSRVNVLPRVLRSQSNRQIVLEGCPLTQYCVKFFPSAITIT